MRWNKFTLKTRSEVEDIVISTLAEAGVEGVEIEDKVPLTEQDKQQMFVDIRAHEVYPVVASGYRTAKKQRELMDDKVDSFLAQGYSRSEAKTEAKKWVADVGYSEHQTGLAVDINADGVNSSGQQVYAWLADNAWKYGFILRYPEDKTEITKTDYEPWHYRYVGKEAAKEIYESGLCLEEYIGMMN